MCLAFATSSSSSISGLSSTEGALAQSRGVGVVAVGVVDLVGADMLIGKQDELWFKDKLVSLL